MNKEQKKELDKWYDDYCRKNKKPPTLGDMVEKEREIVKKGNVVVC